MSDGRFASWRKLAGLVVAYTACMTYSLLLAGATHNLPTIWTANAVVIAGLLLLDRRRGLALVAITALLHVVIELAVGDGLRFVLTISVLDSIQAVATAALLRACRLPTRVRHMWGLLLLVAVSAAFTAVTSIGINGLLSLANHEPFWTGWSDWTTSNVLGVALALPTMLILTDSRLARGFPITPLETLAGAIVAAMVAAAVFANQPSLQALLFAPALLATFRGGPRAVAIVVAVSLAATIPAVLHKTGVAPEQALAPLRQALIFHIVLYAVCLVAALALSRQVRLQALLLRRQAIARAAQARAQAANQAKSDFLATISHEIRTPLNSILGFASLVADDPDLSPESRRRLDLVGRAGRSLAEIVGDLLDFAKVEAGRLDLALTPTSPADLLRDAAAIVAPTADAQGLTMKVLVETRGQADAHDLFALDETRLRQVLLNLLANAVKFTARGGVTARLVLGPAVGALRFEVVDTGIGIAPDVQPRLFERFTQADSSISRGFGGTGLGLAISKALVNRMGGDIGVDSAPGAGSTFWVELMAEPALAAPAPQVEPAITEFTRSARVLLVDDHPMNRELGHALLTLGGYEVVTAEDGATAIALARDDDFDLILMDVHMPDIDGLAATRAIRALPGPAGAVPIVALSADVLPEQIARCRAAGMQDHVAKPINREALLATVERALLPRSEERAQSSVK